MLYLIHGENIYLSNQKLKELKENFSISFEVKDFDFNFFAEKATTTSLFGESVILVLKEFLSQKKKDTEKQIVTFIEKNQPQTTLIFWESKTIKSGTLFKLITKQGEIFHFPKGNKRELKKWLQTEFQKDNFEPESGLEDFMIDWLGQEMFLLKNEVDKLKLNNLDSKKITLESFKKLSFIENSGNIFDFVDSLGNRDKNQSFKIISQILRSGESPHYLFSMVIRQYRLLIQIKNLLENNSSYPEIKKEMNLHPFVSGKLFKQSQKYSYIELTKIYQKLLDIDSQIKIGGDIRLLTELLIEEVCL